jgi:ABC-type branched-subunit amino acid transport system substrate-binding protein
VANGGELNFFKQTVVLPSKIIYGKQTGNNKIMDVYFFLTFLLLIIWIKDVSCLSLNGSKVIKIGLSLGIDDYDYSSIDYATGIFLKAQELHLQPNLVHPDARIEIIFKDTKLEKKGVITTDIDLMQNDKVIAVIGSVYSRLTILSSLLTQTEGLPICCGQSTSLALSDKSQFPNFFRTITNDDQQAVAFYQYLLHNQWTHVAVIHSSDEYGQGLMDKFTKLAASSIKIEFRKSIDINVAQSDLEILVNELKISEMKIIIYFGQAMDFPALLQEAQSKGLYGKGYAWLLSEANYAMDKNDLVEGLIVFYPQECGDGSCLDFMGKWNSSRFTSGFQLANQSSDEPYAGTWYMTSCLELLILG